MFSAYEMNATMLTSTIEGFQLDVVVIDMQGVGVRLYTFIWTMYTLQVAIAGTTTNTQMIVLDR